MLIPVAVDPTSIPVPLLGRAVAAGFPSPADDYLDGEIDLSRHLIERPAATFLMRVAGSSMSGAGILDGDMLVVDRSLQPRSSQIMVAVCTGELTVKRLRRLKGGRVVLAPENPDFAEVVVGEDFPAEVWGVVVGVVRKTV